MIGILNLGLERARNRRAFRDVPQVPGFPTRVLDTSVGRIRTVIAGPVGAPTILLSTDPPMLLEHQVGTIAALAARHRVVAFEVPGFGFSRIAESFRFSLEDFASVFRAVLDATETEAAILCSPCFNNLPALAFALESPARVRGFIGIQAPSWGDALKWVKRTDPLGLFMTPVVGQLITWLGSFQVQKAWLDIAEPDEIRRAEFIRTLRPLHGKGALYCLASGVQATRRPDPFAGRKLTCPSALVWGAADRSHRPTPPASFAGYLDAPKLLVADRAGHFPELTSPALLAEAVAHVTA